MKPALMYRDGTLMAHLWVCIECYRTQAPIYLTEGMPLSLTASEGVMPRPLMLSAVDTAWHRSSPSRHPFRELALRRPHPDGQSVAEDTPVPDDHPDSHPASTRT